MVREKGKSIIFNAKVQNMEEDERCSRFLFKKAFNPKKIIEDVGRTRGSGRKKNARWGEEFLPGQIRSTLEG